MQSCWPALHPPALPSPLLESSSSLQPYLSALPPPAFPSPLLESSSSLQPYLSALPPAASSSSSALPQSYSSLLQLQASSPVISKDSKTNEPGSIVSQYLKS